jgi:hypothetical protein
VERNTHSDRLGVLIDIINALYQYKGGSIPMIGVGIPLGSRSCGVQHGRDVVGACGRPRRISYVFATYMMSW